MVLEKILQVLQCECSSFGAMKGIILCLRPANERWRYNVMLSLIGWLPSQNYPCMTKSSHIAKTCFAFILRLLYHWKQKVNSLTVNSFVITNTWLLISHNVPYWCLTAHFPELANGPGGEPHNGDSSLHVSHLGSPINPQSRKKVRSAKYYWQQQKYQSRQTSDISCIKSHNLNVSRHALQLSLPNPLKSGVKSRMKM